MSTNTMPCMSICVTLCLVSISIFQPAQGSSPAEDCEDHPTSAMSYTVSELVQVRELYDMDVSCHTGNVYILYKDDTVRVLRKGEQETQVIEIERIMSLAVNKRKPEVYMGRFHGGLCIYNENTGNITKSPHVEQFLGLIFLPKTGSAMYVRSYGRSDIYKYDTIGSKGIELNVKAMVGYSHNFVVDGDENFYFTAEGNVSKILFKGGSDPITYNAETFYHLGVDNQERVYGANNKGVYRLHANGTTQLIPPFNFEPLFIKFNDENNIVIGALGGRIFLYKYNYDCYYRNKQELTNNKIQQEIENVKTNMTHEFNQIMHKFNETVEDLRNTTFTEIEKVRDNINDMSMRYNDLIIRIDNQFLEQNRTNIELKNRTEAAIMDMEEKIKEYVDNKMKSIECQHNSIHIDILNNYRNTEVPKSV